MAAVKLPRRGEIFHTDINPTRGKEQAGKRCVFVLSPADDNLAIVLPISSAITLARSQGFAVTLMGAGTRTTGAIICNQPRTVALRERGAKQIEIAPDFIIDEVLLRLAPLVT
ncbi:MAG: type II toxin-antitoxin system PemK/MazF family toxin [Betaproteobacteria bacterium]|nr:MAG: type II toxin-antitoxin system PemK/MazF family toxin [Betaproteobacteria bacterium]